MRVMVFLVCECIVRSFKEAVVNTTGTIFRYYLLQGAFQVNRVLGHHQGVCKSRVRCRNRNAMVVHIHQLHICQHVSFLDGWKGSWRIVPEYPPDGVHVWYPKCNGGMYSPTQLGEYVSCLDSWLGSWKMLPLVFQANCV